MSNSAQIKNFKSLKKTYKNVTFRTPYIHFFEKKKFILEPKNLLFGQSLEIKVISIVRPKSLTNSEYIYDHRDTLIKILLKMF